ncbi:hypothetical protein [Corynebacterium sp.]|uniref:hypothetical protein n=1 Tax=Corynebacterium sp. TaxID=1720 RepID=UPI0028B0144F|nr:hypothetical protein [Corynebacterium sp.]
MAVLYALPGLVVGTWYAGAMLILTLILGRTKRFRGSITPVVYLRVSMFLVLALCTADVIVEPGQESGPWLFFFFLGFQIIVLLTSFFPPEKHLASYLPPEDQRD